MGVVLPVLVQVFNSPSVTMQMVREEGAMDCFIGTWHDLIADSIDRCDALTRQVAPL